MEEKKKEKEGEEEETRNANTTKLRTHRAKEGEKEGRMKDGGEEGKRRTKSYLPLRPSLRTLHPPHKDRTCFCSLLLC